MAARAALRANIMDIILIVPSEYDCTAPALELSANIQFVFGLCNTLEGVALSATKAEKL